MSAEKINGITTGGKRTPLADVIPLSTPYLVQVFPAYACNFKCNYCIHSLKVEERGFISDKVFMNLEIYKKSIDDLKSFPQKIKMLRFAATGEPLLHPDIVEMVAYAKDANIAESIDIVTNGSLLTPELSKSLVNAGLDWLRVSIQGVSTKKYWDVSGVKLSFEKFVKNVSFFYDNKEQTQVYIKTIDIDMSENEKSEFYTIFEPICDKIAIENLTPATSHIDYTKLSERNLDKSQNGNSVTTAEVCPQPFYMLQINSDGNVVPCCAMETAVVLGNVANESLQNIWYSESLRAFRIMQLKKKKAQNQTCASCENYRYGMFDEDVLDDRTEEIITSLKG